MIIFDFFCIASLAAVGVRVVLVRLVLISGLVALRMLSCSSSYLNLLLFEFYKVPPLNQNQSKAQKNEKYVFGLSNKLLFMNSNFEFHPLRAFSFSSGLFRSSPPDPPSELTLILSGI